jgi:hypothetical protein
VDAFWRLVSDGAMRRKIMADTPAAFYGFAPGLRAASVRGN